MSRRNRETITIAECVGMSSQQSFSRAARIVTAVATPVGAASIAGAVYELVQGGEDLLVPMKFDHVGAPHMHVGFTAGLCLYASMATAFAIGARWGLAQAAETPKARDRHGLVTAAMSLALATAVVAYAQCVGVRVARGTADGMHPAAVWVLMGACCGAPALGLLASRSAEKKDA